MQVMQEESESSGAQRVKWGRGWEIGVEKGV